MVRFTDIITYFYAVNRLGSNDGEANLIERQAGILFWPLQLLAMFGCCMIYYLLTKRASKYATAAFWAIITVSLFGAVTNVVFA